jgi:hypothetical protein
MRCAHVTEHRRLTPSGTDYSTLSWQRQYSLPRTRQGLRGDRADARANLPTHLSTNTEYPIPNPRSRITHR